MSPGYDTADQLDFRRTVSYECIFCHAAYPAAGPALNFSGSDSVFGETVLESIDCQRCHGPGRTHVEAAATAGQSRESIRRAILNPGRLTRERQLDVCLQCHLETTASFPVASIRRINREPFSYRPGEPLGDFAIFFDQAPSPARDGKFEFVHAAYSLRKSVCFRASQMTCSTCHNPHQAVRGAQAVEQYSAVCRSCHATAHAAAAATNCIDCHMPKRRSDDVVHAAMTDHAIQRRKPERDLLAPRRETHEAYRGEVAPYYPQQATPLDELYLAVAQVRYSANLAVGIPRLQRAIERQRPTRPEFYFELGVACWKDGRKEAAARWYDEALRHGEYFPALKALGEALFSVGRLTRAALVLERALAASPADADLLCARANLYFRQEQFERAGQVLQQALSSNPDLHQARNLQGVVLGRLGDRNAARQAFREAIRIQPGFDLPHINLALLLAGDGDYAQAGHHLRKAIASNPDSVEAHHTYGMVLTRMKSYDQAAVELREALRLAPNLAEAHGDLAEVLALQGHRQESLEHYRRAIELKPELKSRYTP
jgi:predicted CXXCH cytochrome family protein